MEKCYTAALAGSDYIGVSSDEVLNSASKHRCVNITILEDSVFHGNQTFTVNLTALDPNVLLETSATVITIVEDDG